MLLQHDLEIAGRKKIRKRVFRLNHSPSSKKKTGSHPPQKGSAPSHSSKIKKSSRNRSEIERIENEEKRLKKKE